MDLEPVPTCTHASHATDCACDHREPAPPLLTPEESAWAADDFAAGIARARAVLAATEPTVSRLTLDGAIIPTHATEGELNGWRETQGALLDRDAYRPRPVAAVPANQGALL